MNKVILILLLFFFSFSSKVFAKPVQGLASWYSSKECSKINKKKGCPTASGKSIYELERKHIRFAASNKYRFGTRLKITNRKNLRHTTVIITDRGPNKRFKKRIIDLSQRAFSDLATPKNGLIPVQIEVIS